MIDEAGAMTGSTRGGSEERETTSFSLTIWRATSGSTSQSNSTQMSEIPTAEEERMRLTPAAPLRVCSRGTVTSFSTSSGAMPFASVTTVTDGAVRSGSTSTGMVNVA